MLDSETVIRIYKEAVAGIDPTDTGAEAITYRRKMDAEVAQMREEGKSTDEFHIPPEAPLLD